VRQSSAAKAQWFARPSPGCRRCMHCCATLKPSAARAPRGCTARGMKSCHSSTVNPFTPYAWSDDGIHALGALLRQLHDAAETFSATDDMIWQPWFTRQTGPGTIIGHGDTGPWTVLSDADGIPIAFIDWEYAGPVERIDEVAQTASERAAP
jgi:hypothetical protein